MWIMMDSPPIISIISSLATDQIVTADHLPDPDESYVVSGLYTRCGGKGANAGIAVARLSRRNPHTACRLRRPRAMRRGPSRYD